MDNGPVRFDGGGLLIGIFYLGIISLYMIEKLNYADFLSNHIIAVLISIILLYLLFYITLYFNLRISDVVLCVCCAMIDIFIFAILYRFGIIKSAGVFGSLILIIGMMFKFKKIYGKT